MPNLTLFNSVLAIALVIMVGWLLEIGQNIFLPVFTAVISVYVLTSAAAAMGRLPVVGRLPGWALQLLVLLVFTLFLFGIVVVVSVTVDQLVAIAPTYEQNLETLLGQLTTYFGFRTDPTWEDIRNATIGRVHMQEVLRVFLGSLTSVGGTVFLVVVYAGFLFSERGTFAHKLEAAFPPSRARRAQTVIADVNARIGEYLAVKTLINIILGLFSFLIMWAMGVDFALFWAVMIGLMNYIPYVGSLVGVAFPVVLSLAQFGSIPTTLILCGLLTAAQTFVGNVLEPRWIGRQLNLSPVVVLLALSFWAALWGIPGAILAVPMTSMITIVCGAFPASRFVAVLLSEKVDENAVAQDETKV